MMHSSQLKPIGVFDSGIGGLTVVRQIKKQLPNEPIVYFGDTAHLPYGDKSTASIQSYAVRIADFLLQKKCKIVLIACNSASVAAYHLVRKYVGTRAYVFDVIAPTIDYITTHHAEQTIGLIGTKQTVNSRVYERKITESNRKTKFVSLATPLLVPLIEEGIYEDEISKKIIRKYLSDSSLRSIDALILGCTHYPIIKEEIEAYFRIKKRPIKIVDSAERVALTLKSYLSHHRLMEATPHNEKDKFYVSDYTDSFEKTTKLFFGEEVHLEKVSIWEER